MKGLRALVVAVVASLFLFTFTLSDVYAQGGRGGNGAGLRLRDGSCLTGIGTPQSAPGQGTTQFRGYGRRGGRGGAGMNSGGTSQSITNQGTGQARGAGRGGNGAGLRLRDGSCLTGAGTSQSPTGQSSGQTNGYGTGSNTRPQDSTGVNPGSQR